MAHFRCEVRSLEAFATMDCMKDSPLPKQGPTHRPCYACAHFAGFGQPQSDESGKAILMARCSRPRAAQAEFSAREGCKSWTHLAGKPVHELVPW